MCVTSIQGNVFLSTKWDADTSWQQALQNFIKGTKGRNEAELAFTTTHLLISL
jgi:hypothetical protein